MSLFLDLLIYMKIIIVEENKNFSKDIFLLIADEYGCSISFCSYDECYEVLKKNMYDMIIVDVDNNINDILLLCRGALNIKNDLKISLISELEFNVDDIGGNFIGFCLKQNGKPKLADVLSIIDRGKHDVFIKTFGSFDVFVNNVPISFISAKSKELLALLVDNNGSFVTMNTVLCCFWPDKDPSLSKILYRDAVWKLRKTLFEHDLKDLVCFQRGKLFLNKKNIKCDYFAFLDGNGNIYNYEYMVNYEWSVDRQMQLSDLKKGK